MRVCYGLLGPAECPACARLPHLYAHFLGMLCLLQVHMWESITFAMASLGSAAQAAIEEDVEELQAAATAGSAAADGSSSGAAAAAAEAEAGQEEAAASSAEDDEDLVEYEGMLVSAAAAQRRRCVPGCAQRGYPCRGSSELQAVFHGAGAAVLAVAGFIVLLS